jgi:AraC family transcriptional regulator, regulatory protein of adaptative response / methylated-DNA-[protein]-cysteine methyltransferase
VKEFMVKDICVKREMENSINYNRIEKAIRYLTENFRKQPSLEETAAHVNLSAFHFQRIFSEWAGISPKKFLQYLTVEQLKKDLASAGSIVEAAEKTGLSAQSRVYDLFVNIEAMTPNEFKKKGSGLEINYGFHDTPFGECFIANTERGICSLLFTDKNKKEILEEFKIKWSNAKIKKDDSAAALIAGKIFLGKKTSLKLLMGGTPFQLKVWEALLKIPFGTVSSYGHIASAIGNPGASRAVGSAIGSNPVAYIIPCHRVIRSEGIVGSYHWGTERKNAIIGWEKARINSPRTSALSPDLLR